MITERLVWAGSSSAEGDGVVAYSFPRTLTAEHVGLRGVTGRFLCRYQANIRCPNFEGLEDAPATAKCEALKKVLAAVCMLSGSDIVGVVGCE